MITLRTLSILALVGAVLAGCGGSGGDKTTSTATPSGGSESSGSTSSKSSGGAAPAPAATGPALALARITSECVRRHKAGKKVKAPSPQFRHSVAVLVKAFKAKPKGSFKPAGADKATTLHDALVRVGVALSKPPPDGCGGRGAAAVAKDIRAALVGAHSS